MPTPTVTLFHGTTKSAAARIAVEGWKPLDIVGMVDSLAARYAEEPGAVWADLREYGRFLTHERRMGWVSFSPSKQKAARWAQRAPEARWEVLWAIWRLRHPALAEAWTTNGEGEMWVFREMLAEAPAIISATVPVSALYEGGFLSWRSARLDHEKLGELLALLPDIRTPCPSPSEWVESWEIVDRRVYCPIAAELLNLRLDTFVERAKAGTFGTHEYDQGDPDGVWWPWERFNIFLGDGASESNTNTDPDAPQNAFIVLPADA